MSLSSLWAERAGGVCAYLPGEGGELRRAAQSGVEMGTAKHIKLADAIQWRQCSRSSKMPTALRAARFAPPRRTPVHCGVPSNINLMVNCVVKLLRGARGPRMPAGWLGSVQGRGERG